MIKKLIVAVLLVSCMQVFGQQERKYVRQGNKMFEAEKFEESEVAYRKGLEEDPNSLEVQYNLAGSLYKQKKFEEAAGAYSALTGTAENKEELAKIYHNMGNAYLQGGKLQESVEAYKNALRNNPKDDETRYNLAYAQDKLKQQQQQQQNQQQNQEQNQEQKEGEEKDSQQKQQQKQDQQEQQQEQQQQQQVKISKEDAERMLEAIMQEEKETQQKVMEQQKQSQRTNVEKDW
jgi:Ca-activated chloride channel homolog